jgi:lysophospholipase L1-like esterase
MLKNYIIIGLSIVLVLLLFSNREGFSTNNQIILMGDSILKNDDYVKSSVYDELTKKTKNVINLAKDNSRIIDLYEQLSEISLEMNTKNTYVFISIGGNDILTHKNVGLLFQQFSLFLKSLRKKLSNVNLFIMNLYVPANEKYKIYESNIKKWNDYLDKNALIYNYKVKDLFNLLVLPEDFVYNIEPSETASKKIANQILEN